MVWRVPSNHSTDLFLYGAPYSKWYVYPNIPSAIRPVPHGDGHSIPEPPDNFTMYSDEENSEEQQPSASRDADYLPSTDFSNHNITEGELNNLIRISNFQTIRQNFWHQVYNSGISYTTP